MLGDEDRRAVAEPRHQNLIAGAGRERGDVGATETVQRSALAQCHGRAQDRGHVGYHVDARRLTDRDEADDGLAHSTCSQGRAVSASGFQKPVSANRRIASSPSAVLTIASVLPFSKKPPNASRPAPRISISANWAMSCWSVRPSTIVARRVPSRTTGTISQGSTNWAKLRGS